MKRSFQALDETISDEIWSKFPLQKKHVDHSGLLEKKADAILNHCSRTTFGCNSEAKVVSKCVRVVMRHEFFPKSEQQVS